MMDTATAVMLSTYNGWADDVLFAAMGRLPREHLYRPTKTLFGSMIGTLNHNYQVDVILASQHSRQGARLLQPARGPASRIRGFGDGADGDEPMVH
ncbi:MAG: hypothetical protein WB677_22870 [Xanthobacteraceae bacterium]